VRVRSCGFVSRRTVEEVGLIGKSGEFLTLRASKIVKRDRLLLGQAWKVSKAALDPYPGFARYPLVASLARLRQITPTALHGSVTAVASALPEPYNRPATLMLTWAKPAKSVLTFVLCPVAGCTRFCPRGPIAAARLTDVGTDSHLDNSVIQIKRRTNLICLSLSKSRLHCFGESFGVRE
jgi:hypothetical protein